MEHAIVSETRRDRARDHEQRLARRSIADERDPPIRRRTRDDRPGVEIVEPSLRREAEHEPRERLRCAVGLLYRPDREPDRIAALLSQIGHRSLVGLTLPDSSSSLTAPVTPRTEAASSASLTLAVAPGASGTNEPVISTKPVAAPSPSAVPVS